MFHPFRKKRKVTLDDPVFGIIGFEFDHGVATWSHIPSAADAHMICINAPPGGPSDAQRDFYARLLKTLSSYEEACKSFIREYDTGPPNLGDMTIYAINIGQDDDLAEGQFEIELSDEDANDIHRVVFNNMAPVGYDIDD